MRVSCRAAHLMVALVVMLLLAACQVDADVTVRMGEDGSGTVTVAVTLDPEAAARVPDLAEQLEVADMTEAGWEVSGPETVSGGGVRLVASKAFTSPDEAVQVLGELTGDTGILSEIDFEMDRSFGRTDFRFSARSDLTAGVSALSDAGLVEALGGDGLGGQLEIIEAETGAPADDQVALAVEVALPGAAGTWTLTPGDEPAALELEHTEVRPLPWALAGLAVIAGLSGVGLVVIRLVARRKGRGVEERDAGAGAGEPGEDAGEVVAPPGAVTVDAVSWGAGTPSGSETLASDGEGVQEPARRRLELVVLDADGVMLATGEDVPSLICEVVAARGRPVERSLVVPLWERAAEGRMAVGELWSALGLTADPGDLSDDLLARHRLRPGLREFLDDMLARGLPVAVVADDVAEWSRRLRANHRLDHLTRAWIVSGDVGERLPGGAVLGRVLQATGVDARNALFISHRRARLDAARSFGFAGVLFALDPVDSPGDERGEPGGAAGGSDGGADGGPEAGAESGVDYPVIRSFAEVRSSS